MNRLTRLLLGLVLFGLFLVWRFPYQAAVERSLYEIQQATGAQITYENPQAGPLGVRLRNLKIAMPSGARVALTDASVSPTLSGMVARLRQNEGRANVSLQGEVLRIEAHGIELETGSSDLGKAIVDVENFQYSFKSREGKGDVRMVLPKISAPLPIPDTRIELGAPVQIRPANPGPGTEIAAEVRVSGENLSGAGSVQIRSVPNQPSPTLTGVLDMDAKSVKGSIRLGGTWAKPTWSLNPILPK